MHNTVFILASLVIFIAFFYLLSYCLKMYRSEIIEIRDITMVVIDKDRRRDTRSVYRHGEYETIYETEYKVKVECINNSNKWTYLDGRNYYKKYEVGDTLTMQEIFFKDKDSFFSEIRFATSKNYKDLERFKTNNPNFLEEYTMEELEYYIEEYHEERTNSTNLLNMILFPILLVTFIFGFISISKIFKEYGSTVTLNSSINIGGGNLISEIDKIEIEGTNKGNIFGVEVPNPKDLPRPLSLPDTKKIDKFNLEPIKTTEEGNDIYIIKSPQEATISYKQNGELKQSEYDKSDSFSNLEINYDENIKKPNIEITETTTKYYEVEDRDNALFTDEQLLKMEPSWISTDINYKITLKEPSQLETYYASIEKEKNKSFLTKLKEGLFSLVLGF